jgi:hypothetical protein
MELDRISERVRELTAQGEQALSTAQKADNITYVDQRVS